MPVYEYACTIESCLNEWEEEQKISDDPQTLCPKCQKESAKRLISGGQSFQLMGGGWANEGYK